MDQSITLPVGAQYLVNGSCLVRVWAPFSKRVQLIIKGKEELQDLVKNRFGYWQTEVREMPPGTRYMFLLDGESRRPDPASACQPEGVHSWSEVIQHPLFRWSDEHWSPPDLEEMIIYELHVGTFSPEGTFESLTDKLDHLLDLGINAIELMPIAQFPGHRNWGYDGVYPFAPQYSYGGVGKLKQMVDKCHQKGIAVILDVVYNHLGPEGNYLADFGPYFTDKYHTPWGSSLNFDDQYCDPVRSFFFQNALTWLKEFHFDGLRLDAVHAILDNGPVHFLKELRQKTDQLQRETGKKYCLIAESDMNDVKIISGYEKGGYGLEAQWLDDFHHAVHTLATGEREGYYQDYGKINDLAKCLKQGFIYDGIYSEYRKKKVGNNPSEISSGKLVVCLQNHDQIGNRMLGERLSQLVSFEMLKLSVGVMFISPFIPMLFMGEEYGADQNFQYFVSHGDPDLVKAIQEGRKKEFEAFQWAGETPDPQSINTFDHSKLQWNYAEDISKSIVLSYYKHLIRLRKEGKFKAFKSKKMISYERENLLHLIAEDDNTKTMACLNFNHTDQKINVAKENTHWIKILGSSDMKWGGSRDSQETIPDNGELIIPSTSLLIYQQLS